MNCNNTSVICTSSKAMPKAKLAALVVLATILSSCSKEITPTQERIYTFELSHETKATLGDFVTWQTGDKVGLMVGTDGFNGYGNVTAGTPPTVSLYSTSTIAAGTTIYSYYPQQSGGTATAAKISIPATQYGSSSSAMPLAGIPMTLAEDTESGTAGELRFMNLAGILDFHIYSTNSAYCSETVQSITFAADQPITGTGTLDLTALNQNDEATLTVTGYSGQSAKVIQSEAVVASKTDAGSIAMIVFPGSCTGTLTIITDQAGYTFTLTKQLTATRSGRTTVNANLANAVRGAIPSEAESLPYSEPFTINQGAFTIEDVTNATGSSIWSFNSTYGMKASAYINKTNCASESWLVSPMIDLSSVSSATLTFSHAAKYFTSGSEAANMSLWARTSASGKWTQLTIPTYPTGWNFTGSGEIALDAYCGGEVQIGFKYVSTTSVAPTWEIKSFSVTGSGSAPEPVSVTPALGKTEWLEMPAASEGEHLHYLEHYAALGSNSKARNYTSLYDDSTYAAYWVAYPLCASHMGSLSRSDSWAYDSAIDQSYQTKLTKGYGVSLATTNYSSNSYARGHQIPNADRNGVADMQTQTFVATNSTPQIQDGFNGGIWANLETAIRGYVPSTTAASDTVYVVTGAVFQTVGGSETISYITNQNDSKSIPVPNYYWKAVLKVKRSGSTITDASMIGFWLPHADLKGKSYTSYTVSVDEIESKTGFDLFVNLPDDLETAAEKNSTLATFTAF